MSGLGQIKRRIVLTPKARKFRRDYVDVFGSDIPTDCIKEVHETLVNKFGAKTYTLRNMQNWFSNQRRHYGD
ncbi:hypothetical protein C8Q78DRAFT_1001567 [Trametes maxima]|nr:hypothetical protein C8Q78DRAFT_1001567 [Trametes maxima]